MDIFISWSGERSRALAETLVEWLPTVIQSLNPWVSTSELNKGERWAEKIGNALSQNSIGLICVTPENLNSPWLMFEAGALSKQIENAKVCPILLNMDSTPPESPLSQFQSTVVREDDMLKLCNSLNFYLGDNKIKENNLKETFNDKWPKFEEKIKEKLSAANLISDSYMISVVLDNLKNKGFPQPIWGKTVQFDSGFESHMLYDVVTKLAKKRLYIFGRKNRKLFDKEHKTFFEDLSLKIDNGFDFRCLFLDSNSPEYVLSSAHQDDDFPKQLEECIEKAAVMLNRAGVDPIKVCRTYKIQRQLAIIIVDEAVIYSPIEIDSNGKTDSITRCPFSITGIETPSGRRYSNIFNSVWEAGGAINLKK